MGRQLKINNHRSHFLLTLEKELYSNKKNCSISLKLLYFTHTQSLALFLRGLFLSSATKPISVNISPAWKKYAYARWLYGYGNMAQQKESKPWLHPGACLVFPHIYCLVQQNLKYKGLAYGAGVMCCSSLYAAQKYYAPNSRVLAGEYYFYVDTTTVYLHVILLPDSVCAHIILTCTEIPLYTYM